MTVIPLLEDDALASEIKAVFAETRTHHRDVPNLYRLLAHAPELLKAWTALGWPLRSVSYVDRGLRELAIMRTAQLTGATYVWANHWHMAIAAGVDQERVSKLSDWLENGFFNMQERAVLALTDAIVERSSLDRTTIDIVAAQFDRPAIVHLALTVSFYVCVAKLTCSFDLDLEPGFDDVLVWPFVGGDPRRA